MLNSISRRRTLARQSQRGKECTFFKAFSFINKRFRPLEQKAPSERRANGSPLERRASTPMMLISELLSFIFARSGRSFLRLHFLPSAFFDTFPERIIQDPNLRSKGSSCIKYFHTLLLCAHLRLGKMLSRRLLCAALPSAAPPLARPA